MKVGEKIRILRLNNNWTQGALAHLLGVSEITIRNYELGKGGIRPKHIEKLANIFQIDKTVLTGDDLESYHDIMQVLFKLRDEFDLKVVSGDQVPSTAGVVLYFDNPRLQEYIEAWHKTQTKTSKNGEDIEALRAWELMFPKALVEETKIKLQADRKRGTINEEDLKD